MELTEIKSKGISWGQAATELNNNFAKVNNAVEQVKNATTRNKGFFASENDLKNAHKTAVVGDIAYVGTESPFTIWEWKNNAWSVTSGKVNANEVNLGDYYNKEQIDAKIKPVVYDGGRADSTYGGAMIIDCGTALH